MIIPRVHVHKDFNDPAMPYIQILVSTTFRLYRFLFRIQQNEFKTQSLFYNFSAHSISSIDATNTFAISLAQVDYGNIFVAPSGEAIFSFILPTNSVSCVQMPPVNKAILYNPASFNPSNQALPIKYELNQPNIVKRLWSGITRYSIKENLSIII